MVTCASLLAALNDLTCWWRGSPSVVLSRICFTGELLFIAERQQLQEGDVHEKDEEVVKRT
jgi:hypothetical protein